LTIPSHYLLSSLLQQHVRCNKGFDHGLGVIAWMHPPVHRLLGWASKPSNLSLKRCVWRLDQLKAITYKDVFVKGLPAESDQATINRFPTLMEAALLNKKGEKIANIADLIFDTKTGNILYYLVSRTNPKLPGTSRWRFDLERIVDQAPGCVSSNISTIDELPLIKSSIRQDFLKKSKKLKDNFVQFSSLANQKLEGWLDENPLEDSVRNLQNNFSERIPSRDDLNELNINNFNEDNEFFYSDEYNRSELYKDNEEDPWI